MRIIVDTNRIIAALIRDSASREILFSKKFEFYTVSLTLLEIGRYKREIIKKAGIEGFEFEPLLSLFLGRIRMVEDKLIKLRFDEAKKIMDDIDRDDTPFIALSLALDYTPIWTDDAHFYKQKVVKALTTQDMLKLVGGL